ncbi:MAG TPA: nitrous oxide reductase accessory protein NosL [Thermodesulfobacteriota bacterium]
MTRRRLFAAAAGLVAGCAAAAREPRAILVGAESCAFCRMTILDERVAAEYLVDGRVVVFDDAGCLRDWVLARGAGAAGAAWLRDYAGEGWVRAESAVLVAGAVATPMSTNVVAFASGAAADALVGERGGRRIALAELLGPGAAAGRRYALADEPSVAPGQGRAGHGGGGHE